ncbi:hypothetical protein C0989_012083 [Termitomyces sp. Mn162]|nr:hypothetical protein C0989_012083 [Termitomyces sp. Mn162]
MSGIDPRSYVHMYSSHEIIRTYDLSQIAVVLRYSPSPLLPDYAMLTTTLPRCNKQERFFASSQFAVIGASSDTSRLANEVSRNHSFLTMTNDYQVLDWYRDKHMDVTLSLLKQAHKLSIPTIWIQPGAADQYVIDYIEANNLSEKVIWGGPCILREGDYLIQRRWFDETYS